MNIAILIGSVLVACMGAWRGDRGTQRIGTAVITCAYGVIEFFDFGFFVLFLGDVRSGAGLLGAGMFIVVGVRVLLGYLPRFVGATLTVATLLVMQGMQLRLYIHGSEYDYGDHPIGVWCLQVAILVSLIVNYCSCFPESGVRRNA